MLTYANPHEISRLGISSFSDFPHLNHQKQCKCLLIYPPRTSTEGAKENKLCKSAFICVSRRRHDYENGFYFSLVGDVQMGPRGDKTCPLNNINKKQNS